MGFAVCCCGSGRTRISCREQLPALLMVGTFQVPGFVCATWPSSVLVIYRMDVASRRRGAWQSAARGIPLSPTYLPAHEFEVVPY